MKTTEKLAGNNFHNALPNPLELVAYRHSHFVPMNLKTPYRKEFSLFKRLNLKSWNFSLKFNVCYMLLINKVFF